VPSDFYISHGRRVIGLRYFKVGQVEGLESTTPKTQTQGHESSFFDYDGCASFGSIFASMNARCIFPCRNFLSAQNARFG
jgi:hypothetical protein